MLRNLVFGSLFVFLVALSGSAKAELVLDNFVTSPSYAANGNGVTYSSAPNEIQRSVMGADFKFNSDGKYFAYDDFIMTYTVLTNGAVGGTFGQLGAGDMLSLDVAVTGSFSESDFNVLIGSNTYTLTELNSGVNFDISGLTTFNIFFDYTGSGSNGQGSKLLIGSGNPASLSSFSAVPEPTSLALAGMGLASVCCIRRRRK